MRFEECEFRTKSGVLRGKRWGKRGGIPVLALHGWLDNCASFDVLAPFLPNMDLIALDLAGNGASDFRLGEGAYNIWRDLQDIFSVKNILDWNTFSIIGHSKGAMIGLLYSGVFPEHVNHLVCLDAFSPEPLDSSSAPAQLAVAIKAAAKECEQKRTLYRSLDDAINARTKGLFTLSVNDATLLAGRGVEVFEGGFCWRFDSNLLLPSEIKFTKEQLGAFVARIPFSVLLLVANDGIAGLYKEALQEVEELSNVQCEYLDGGHHFHMTENAEGVAFQINRYIK